MGVEVLGWVGFEQIARAGLAQLRLDLIGKHVRLKKSKFYKGREAQIDGVILSPEGQVLCLAMVLRCDDNKTFLNDKPYSRSYWPIDELEWL